MSKQEDPATSKTAFNCPHCGAYTTQTWFALRAVEYEKDEPTPKFADPDQDWAKAARDLADSHEQLDLKQAEAIVAHWQSDAAGNIRVTDNGDRTWVLPASNCNLSKCFHCKKITVWVHRRIVDPPTKLGVAANEDMPQEIAQDFEEARSILGLSPRGAAALLRLCVEKLCKHLKAKGNKIDHQIADLVSKGLDDRVKDALDVVRVIGNKAVHEGRLDDGDDDPELAHELLILVNEIVSEMISKPKRLDAMKSRIPPGAQNHIEKRDAKAKAKAKATPKSGGN